MTTLNISANEQLNKLMEFRQIICEEILREARDAQFETIDSLLLLSDHRQEAELTVIVGDGIR